jgi:hypothetical protein
MRTFLNLDTQVLGSIGKAEISDFGGLISFGMGGMYEINTELAIESMISVSLVSANSQELKGLQHGLQFWVEFRYFLEKKADH